ncbi:O-antigen ligase family protein [Mucilaginibacter sp. KACC 22773]|uniref:O-antigen ligase family protein n=1 Tax=Mucilaginibacter sp. KACC 22773 TaxID=3025671 RepID=UPI002365C3FA|nr:O-antigen ligase family protein [Mucilaginibacter sp. KACC 22773]WDF80922.1 O-antigen ligase family protein [Mucilaginibacter sp. KACC 22773]
MKQLLLINDNNANKVSYYHIMLLMASLPFDRFYSHIILISFIVHTFIHLQKEKLRIMLTLKTVVLQSVFFVTLIATVYSLYRSEAFNEWVLRLPILILPPVFLLNGLDLKKYRANFLFAFAIVCTATIIYLYIDALITIKYYHLPLKTIFSPAFTNHNFSEPLDIHATFFSLQLVVALVYLLALLFKPLTLPVKLICSICSFILLCGLIQLSSKSILAILFIIINLVLPYCLLKGKSRLKFITAGAAISALAFATILNVSSFKERYLTSLTDDFSAFKPGESTDSRLARWHVVAQLIKQKPLIGHGSGSEQKLLHDEFFKAKMYDSFLANLNSHNQYLSFVVKSGIWGLLVYLVTLAYGFKTAILKKDVVFISFMLLITIVSLSENVLDADKGVMFYSLFFALLLFSGGEVKPEEIVKNKSPEYLDEVATNSLALTSY